MKINLAMMEKGISFWFLIALSVGATISVGAVFFPIVTAVVVCVIAIVGWVFVDVRSFLLFLLVTKPLVDLTWNGPFLHIAGQDLNIQSGLAIVTFFLLGAYIIIVERPRINTPAGWLLGFLALNCLSYGIGITNAAALKDLMRLWSGVPMLFLGYHIFGDRNMVQKFTVLFLCMLAVPYYLSYLQLTGVIDWGYRTMLQGEEKFRTTGGYMHPVDLFRFIFLAIPLIFLAWNKSKSVLAKIFLLIGFCSAWVFTGLTLLRMGVFTLAAQCFLWPWLNKRRFAAFGSLAAAVIAFVLLEFMNTGIFTEQFQTIAGPPGSGKALNYRGAVWEGYLDLYLSGSLSQQLLGYGLYTDALRYQLAFNENLVGTNDAHSDFLGILVGNGLIGLLTYLGFILSLFLSIRRAIREAPDSSSQGYAFLAMILLMSFMMLSLTIRITIQVSGFWYLLAVCSPIVINQSTQQGE